ncbi:MAG TPA: hypothetical protein VHG70_09070 [Nocardioidaceae bacterium]|nr:hypothetical protein [Nocardioidaceae bacterium]
MPDISIAIRSLEHALSTMPQSSSWRSLVANRVQGLRDAYLQEVERGPASDAFAVDAPWLCGRMQVLRREQSRIVDELEALARASFEAMDMETLRAQVQLALQRIMRLRQRENDLIYESVDLDLGGEQ